MALTVTHVSTITLSHVPFLFNKMLHTITDYVVYTLAKQHRLSFPSNSIFTNAPFQLLHLDLWDPYHHTCHSGPHYMLTIVNDYFRTTCVYFLYHKSQTRATFINFSWMISTQFFHSFKIISTNNGTKFINNTFRFYLLDHGILHQKIWSHTP